MVHSPLRHLCHSLDRLDSPYFAIWNFSFDSLGKSTLGAANIKKPRGLVRYELKHIFKTGKLIIVTGFRSYCFRSRDLRAQISRSVFRLHR